MPDVWLVLSERADAGRCLYELVLATRNGEVAIKLHAEKLSAGEPVLLARQVLPHTRPADSLSMIDF